MDDLEVPLFLEAPKCHLSTFHNDFVKDDLIFFFVGRVVIDMVEHFCFFR